MIMSWQSCRPVTIRTTALAVALAAVAAAQVDTAWVRRYNGPGNGTDDAQAVATDAAGNVYVAGYSLGSGTSADYCLVKYDEFGSLLWTARYNRPTNGADYCYGLAVDALGNAVVTGHSYNGVNYDYATVKYDPNGTQLWAAFWNDSLDNQDYAVRVALDGGGNAIVTGYAWGGANYDYVTIKYDVSGNELWRRRYNGPANGNDYATCVVVDPADNVIVGGYSIGTGYDYLIVKYDAAGNQVWTARYNGTGNSSDYLYALATDAYGNVHGTGASYGAAGADNDFLTVKYDAAGNPAAGWPVRYNGPGNDNDEARSVMVDAAGNVYVCGGSNGVGTNLDFCVACYDASGAELWVRRINGSADAADIAYQLALDTARNVYATGYVNATGLGTEWLTVKYSRFGDEQWQRSYGRPGAVADISRAICLDSTGNACVAGYTTGTGSDFTVVKYMQPDVAVDLIGSPRGRYDTIAPVVPSAYLRNYGTAPTTVKAWLWLATAGGTRVYLDSALVTLLRPGENRLIVFDTWPLRHPVGHYRARCSTGVAFDRTPDNDTADAEFTIAAGNPGWWEVRAVPVTPSGREVKDGASLAWCAGNGLVYCLKGNKTGDFYSYNPLANVWIELPPVPNGPANKGVSKGGVLVSDGGSNLYCVKGNNTEEFWRYSSTGGWSLEDSVPLVPSGKKVKGGGDAAWAGGCVYFLKGYGNDFYRYNPATREWEELPAPPVGYKPKWNRGSFIVSDGGRYIYACKAKYNELWRYDIVSRAWSQTALAPLPFFSRTGKTKKLKDGGCGVWYLGNIYALKGGNTQEFWCYNAAANSWRELDTIPAFGSTGVVKRVKSGADIASAGFAFYALKGGKTRELWRYILPDDGDGAPTGRADVQAWPCAAGPQLCAGPSPCRGTLRFALSAPFRGAITVTDAAGREVLRRHLAGTTGTLDVRGLAAGVYLLRAGPASARFVVGR